MKPQFANKVMRSVQLWAAHVMEQENSGYFNHSGYFYDVTDSSNFYTYALPYKGLVSDMSVSGANHMTGIYLDGSFIMTGQNGLTGINFDEGQVYFNTEITNADTRLSGNYAVKEINVKLTTVPEEILLFETKHYLNAPTDRTISGLAPNTATYPVLYLRKSNFLNEEIAFGGTEETECNIKGVIMAESQFQLDAVQAIFEDKARCYVPLIEQEEEPFNIIGDYKTGDYNYLNTTAGKIPVNSLFIKDVFTQSLDRSTELATDVKSINAGIYVGFIDIRLTKFRNPRG